MKDTLYRCAKNITHELMLESDEYGTPARINRHVFDLDDQREVVALKGYSNLTVKVGRPIAYANRVLISFEVTTPKGDVMVLPFYRSSGVNNPGSSPKGTWWPCAGVLTDAFSAHVAEKFGRPTRNNPGWIMKYRYTPTSDGGFEWMGHNKTAGSVDAFNSALQEWLSDNDGLD